MESQQNLGFLTRYRLIKIILGINSVIILGLIIWMSSPNFRAVIKLKFDGNIPLLSNQVNNSISNSISLIKHDIIPSGQILDATTNTLQSHQYQYRVEGEQPSFKKSNIKSGKTSPSSHLVTVDLYYGSNNGDLQHKLELAWGETKSKKFNISPKQNRYGWYGLFTHDQKAYLTSCINVRGGTTLNQEQFLANRNRYDLQLNRLPAYLMGLTHWRDHRCIWVVMHTPILEAPNQSSANSNSIDDNSEYLALEKLWQEIYPHWQKQIPPDKFSL